MTRVRKALDASKSHIYTLRALIVGLLLALAYSMHGLATATERIVVDIPPDLRNGSTQHIGERLPSSVWSFGLYLFQMLNHWPTKGTEDYREAIESYACYLTPEFKAELLRDYERKDRKAELNRTRSIMELPGAGYEPRRIYVESDSSWVGFYDVKLVESFNGEVVKEVAARYPLRIVSWNTNFDCNPFGLAISGFYAAPKRLESRAQQADIQNTSGQEI